MSKSGIGMPTSRHHSALAEIKSVGAVIKLQSIATIIAALLAFLIQAQAVRSVIYGSVVALLSSIYLLRRMQRAESLALDAKESLRQVQQTAAVRFAMTAVLLALPLLHRHGFLYAGVWMGFVAGQIVWLIGIAFVQVAQQKSGQDKRHDKSS